MFQLQISIPITTGRGWMTIAHYEDIDTAIPACERAVLSEKCDARIFSMETGLPVEHFRSVYSRAADPEIDHYAVTASKEDDLEIDWRGAGF
jgi:hypothetical protein